MQYDKVLVCTSGAPGNTVSQNVEFSGRLTAAAAREAARRAFGHTQGVTVYDPGENVTYRCTASGTRKVNPR